MIADKTYLNETELKQQEKRARQTELKAIEERLAGNAEVRAWIVLHVMQHAPEGDLLIDRCDEGKVAGAAPSFQGPHRQHEHGKARLVIDRAARLLGAAMDKVQGRVLDELLAAPAASTGKPGE